MIRIRRLYALQWSARADRSVSHRVSPAHRIILVELIGETQPPPDIEDINAVGIHHIHGGEEASSALG